MFSVLYSGICIVSRFSCVFRLFNIVFIKHFLVPPPFYAKYWNSWNFSMKSENRQYITRVKATNTCFEAKFPFLFFLFNLFFLLVSFKACPPCSDHLVLSCFLIDFSWCLIQHHARLSCRKSPSTCTYVYTETLTWDNSFKHEDLHTLVIRILD